MIFDKSLKYYKQALNLIPMGTSTFSKNPNLYTIGASPLFVNSAKGSKIVDVDGNEFIDYMMALSITILGYSNEDVNNAAKSAIDEGLLYTLSCPEEQFLAKRIIDLVPCAEMVRFVKNGSDSCEGAVKLARVYTGKLKVMSVSGYHGFHDWFTVSTERSKGIPKIMSEWVIPHSYNDIESIERTIRANGNEIACLIMEPVINREPENGFLQKIRCLTEDNNIVLIFDEMKTGFRLSIGGAQEYFNVIPDLAVFGKALSNGFPLSALVGKRKIMKLFEDEKVFFSGSYATEKASLRAGLKTLEIIQNENVLDYVWEIGDSLKKGLGNLVSKYNYHDFMEVVGFPPLIHLLMKDHNDYTINEIKSFIQQECAKRKLLHFGAFHPSYAHSVEDINYTLEVYDKVFSLLKDVIERKVLREKLEGSIIRAFGLKRLN